MNLPEIAVYNFSSKSDADVQQVIRAVNRQVLEDFLPVWGSGYVCQLKKSDFTGAPGEAIAQEPVTSDAALYVIDDGHLPGAAGYHFQNGREVPYGFVFTSAGEWTVTLSHEVLELIVDSTANAFVPGPDPRNGDNLVLHAYEVCDAVERTSYPVDGVTVSNFVTPSYFTSGDTAGTRNDFLGTPLKSFGLLPGCHVGFIDLSSGTYETFVRPGAMESAGGSAKRAARLREAAARDVAARIPDGAEKAIGYAVERLKGQPGAERIASRALRRLAYKDEGSRLLSGLRRSGR